MPTRPRFLFSNHTRSAFPEPPLASDDSHLTTERECRFGCDDAHPSCDSSIDGDGWHRGSARRHLKVGGGSVSASFHKSGQPLDKVGSLGRPTDKMPECLNPGTANPDSAGLGVSLDPRSCPFNSTLTACPRSSSHLRSGGDICCSCHRSGLDDYPHHVGLPSDSGLGRAEPGCLRYDEIANGILIAVSDAQLVSGMSISCQWRRKSRQLTWLFVLAQEFPFLSRRSLSTAP